MVLVHIGVRAVEGDAGAVIHRAEQQVTGVEIDPCKKPAGLRLCGSISRSWESFHCT